MLCNTQGMPEKEEYYYRMAEQNKVDGIICVTYQDVEPYVSENIPLISLDRHFHKKVSCIREVFFEVQFRENNGRF